MDPAMERNWIGMLRNRRKYLRIIGIVVGCWHVMMDMMVLVHDKWRCGLTASEIESCGNGTTSLALVTAVHGHSRWSHERMVVSIRYVMVAGVHEVIRLREWPGNWRRNQWG